ARRAGLDPPPPSPSGPQSRAKARPTKAAPNAEGSDRPVGRVSTRRPTASASQWRAKARPAGELSCASQRRCPVPGPRRGGDPRRMPNYRRAWVKGGTYFYAVNLLDRRQSLLVDELRALRAAFREAGAARPFA